MANIWTRKSTAELLREAAEGDRADGEVRALKRTLSALNLVALGIGGIIGAGIFVLTGHAAATNAMTARNTKTKAPLGPFVRLLVNGPPALADDKLPWWFIYPPLLMTADSGL